MKNNEPTWSTQKVSPGFKPLKQHVETDVVIVGGGLAGVLSAYVLASAGKRVVVLEKDRLGNGVTSATTAFLTQIIDTDFTDAVSMYGAKNTKLIWESHGTAIDLIEQIIKKEKIDCEFIRCSNFSYGNSEGDVEQLEQEFEAMKKLGFQASYKKQAKLPFEHYGCIEVKKQAKYHPLLFLRGLTAAAQKLGVEFYEQTEVKKISGDEPVRVEAAKYTVTARYAITATYDPLNNPKETFMKKGMYASYVYELAVPKGMFPEGLYEDNENPYHYFRVDAGTKHDRVIIGGEDNRKEIEFNKQKNFRALEAYIKQIMGDKKYTVVRKWSGPILEPSDGLALIGEFKPHQLIATAFSGNGMTYSGIAALIFRDIITKKKNPWRKMYDPTRIPTAKQLAKKFIDYAEEFVYGAAKNTLKH